MKKYFFTKKKAILGILFLAAAGAAFYFLKKNPQDFAEKKVFDEDDIYFQNNGKTPDQRLESLRAYIKKISDSEIKKGNASDEVETEAEIYARKSRDVARYLQQVSTQEKESGKTETASRIESVAIGQNEVWPETFDAIKTLENRKKWKRILLGNDWSALEKIKISLQKNKKKIAEIIELSGGIHSVAAKNSIEQQLTLLLGERERIKKIIRSYEDEFSFLGWFSKWKSGYKNFSSDSQDEEEIMRLVENVFRAQVTEIVEPPKIESGNKKINKLPEEEIAPASSEISQ